MIIQRQLQQKISVKKIYPHVGKKNFYYFFGLVIRRNEVKKSFPHSKYLITRSIQGIDNVKNIKNFWSRWRSFFLTHPNSMLWILGIWGKLN